MPKTLVNTVWNYFYPPCKISHSFWIHNFEDIHQPDDQNYQKSIKFYLNKTYIHQELTAKDQEFLYVMFRFLDYLHTKFDLYFLNIEVQNDQANKPSVPLTIKLKFKSAMLWDNSMPSYIPQTEEEKERLKNYINKFEDGAVINSQDILALDHLKALLPDAIVQQDTPEYRGTIDLCEHKVQFDYKALKNIIYSLEIPEKNKASPCTP